MHTEYYYLTKNSFYNRIILSSCIRLLQAHSLFIIHSEGTSLQRERQLSPFERSIDKHVTGVVLVYLVQWYKEATF
jgi:hypothetical protein